MRWSQGVAGSPYACLVSATVDVMLCERCGAELPIDARFCPRCGSPVAAVTTDERKVVSILFADLARSTELAARLDPERFREVMAAFYTSVSAQLESLRGRAEKFVGDAVMAVWGIPQAHDDDALRAIRAGLMIRDRVTALAGELGLALELQVRVGVNSGAVATGSGPADQFLVSGAPVNLASRLQEAAEPNEILVGPTAHELAKFAVEFGEPRIVPARGFAEPVRAWPVVGLSTRTSRRTIPLVDRKRELALLVGAFERVRETGRSHLVTVLGQPGIGKSRLVDEFVAGLPEEARVLTGRTSDFEEEATFAPLADMIRREIGVSGEAPAADVRDRLRDIVAGCCEPSERDQVAARLGLALGLGRDLRGSAPEEFWTESLARFDELVETEGGERQRFRRAELAAGFLKLLEGMSRAGPVVMRFEDLHVAQPELLDLIEQLIRGARRLPVLVVCLARDYLLEVKPGWGGGIPDALTIHLDRLTDRQAAELAKAAGESIAEDTAARIVELAGGNPFFIIETTGMLLQRHEAHDMGAMHTHLLPPTVQAVVASRIDHLAPDARELIRKASVFPRATFSSEELALITEPREDLLRSLEDAELVARDPGRSEVWRFQHALLREVAYESLPKRERERLHLQVAEGIAGWGKDRYPQAIAYHLEQAARAGLDLDPGDRRLADRAVKALSHAADVARRRMESRTAIDLYGRALALAGPPESWGRREAVILSFMGEARYWLGEYDEAGRLLSRALDHGEADPWVRAHALRFLADIALNVQGEIERGTRLFDDALVSAREAGDPWTMARTLLMAGWAPYWQNDIEGAKARFEEALRIARENPERDRWAEARALTSLASVPTAVGDEEESLALGRQALALGREMGDPFTIGVAQEIVGNSLRRMLRLDEAVGCLEESVGIFRDLAARWELASALGDRGDTHRLAGRLDLAEADMREALALCRQLGERSLITWTLSQLIRILILRGDLADAADLVEVAARTPVDEPGSRAALLIAQSLLALAKGEPDRARRLALQVMELERDGGWRNPLAARTWLVGRLFGADAVGGEAALGEARRTLESAHWLHALREPELILERAEVA